MRIFAAGLATETNTFAPLPTGLGDFLVQRGREAAAGRVDHPSLDLSSVWGRQAAKCAAEFVFSLNAWAEPAGLTVKSAYELLRDEILNDLRAAMPVDVVLLMLHGAMVAEGYEDCEQDLIRCVRDVVGSAAVIGVELDLHCNLTYEKIAAADLVITFKEYPHVDINDRARELFDLALATKRGTVRPTMALFECRMIGFYPTTRAPLRGFVDAMSAAERHPRICSISFAHGFPFADLPHLGASMLVVTDGDRGLAERTAQEFGMRAYDMRREIGFDGISLPLDTALSRAVASGRTPVIVADQSDNVGGGAPGDSTFALRWLLEHAVQDASIAIMHDPEVVKIARKVGVGARLAIRLGGKLGATSGDPLDIQVTVEALRSDYLHARPQQSGEELLSPLGDVAALRCAGIDIVVGSKRCQCYSPSIFYDLGIELTRKQLVVVKSTQHFYQGFAPIAAEVIYMAGPGAVAPDPKRIPYRRVETGRLYPWNEHPRSD